MRIIYPVGGRENYHKMQKYIVCFIAAFFLSATGVSATPPEPAAIAESEAGRTPINPAVDRPKVLTLTGGEYELFFMYDRFDKSWAPGAGRLGESSARLEMSATQNSGFQYAFSDRFGIRYIHTASEAKISRPAEPMELNGHYFSHDLRFQREIYGDGVFRLALEAGYRSHKAASLDIYRVTRGTWTLYRENGGSLFTTNSWDGAYLVSMRSERQLGDDWRIGAGLEWRRVTAEVKVDSTLWDDSLAGSSLQAEAAKYGQWTEDDFLLDVYIDWRLSERIGLAFHGTFYDIRRKDYIARPNTPDYTRNFQLDGYLFGNVSEHFDCFFHGRASSNYVLGDVPFQYNYGDQHFYKYPYGYVSFGVAYHR